MNLNFNLWPQFSNFADSLVDSLLRWLLIYTFFLLFSFEQLNLKIKHQQSTITHLIQRIALKLDNSTAESCFKLVIFKEVIQDRNNIFQEEREKFSLQIGAKIMKIRLEIRKNISWPVLMNIQMSELVMSCLHNLSYYYTYNFEMFHILEETGKSIPLSWIMWE